MSIMITVTANAELTARYFGPYSTSKANPPIPNPCLRIRAILKKKP
jgi:hypothetical protein